MPFQNQSVMPAVYRLGKVLILPSSGSQETWGLCVNEAMASGISAVVSSHVGCAADLINEGETGWVFPAGNGDALQKRIKALALEQPERASFSEALSAKIDQYSYQKATQGLVEALEAVL